MRLFVAVNFTDKEISNILKIQEELRARSSSGNFSRPENLHLTLAFLGETPEDRLESVFRILEEIRFLPFDLSFDHAGSFTRRGSELWWIGAAQNSAGLAALKAVQEKLVSRLAEQKFSVDTKPFNAHITLARDVKHRAPIAPREPAVTVRVERASLMKSEHIRGALTYTALNNTGAADFL